MKAKKMSQQFDSRLSDMDVLNDRMENLETNLGEICAAVDKVRNVIYLYDFF